MERSKHLVCISKTFFHNSQWYLQLSSHKSELLNIPSSNKAVGLGRDGWRDNSFLLSFFLLHFIDTVDFPSAYFSFLSYTLWFSFYVGKFFCNRSLCRFLFLLAKLFVKDHYSRNIYCERNLGTLANIM